MQENDYSDYIEFRQLPAFFELPERTEAKMKGSRLAVWQVIQIAIGYEMNPEKVAEHFQKSIGWVNAAFDYAERYPEEIDRAIERSNSLKLKKIFPQLEGIEIPKDN